MKIDFTDKNYLVTGGAGTGVGAGICEAISDCGGTLLLNDLDLAKTEVATRKYPKSHAIVGDISDTKDVKRIFREIKEKYGLVHGLVNNAGIGLHKDAHLVEESEFDNLYKIDVKGVWLMARAFVKQLMEANEVGHIVNISSVHARETTARYAIYASAKAAVEGLTRGMSIELGEFGVRCNAVAPGYVDSEQSRDAVASWTDAPKAWIDDQKNDYQSLRHMITARDCGNAVVFLLSHMANSITGQTLTVDAGFTNLLYANSFIPKT
ncbi:SDR family NAD(P)-dependent oxidoreductase [Ulvibacterium sp.]|uniref:SDR family NAD(P)-dependent oxidoreductase n=1 Tax=Ulvibacterium sp. TaxID=2665914 RepID=UPI00260218FC|nr:SDR family oxidoreductase [Ulvibacterium sp.]